MALESINVCLGAELPRHSISERWSCNLKRSVMANSIPLVVLRLQAPCALSETSSLMYSAGGDPGGGGWGGAPPPPEMTCGFLIQLVFCKKKAMWFIGVEVKQETSAPPPRKNPGSAPAQGRYGTSIFSVRYSRRHCAQDTWQLGIVSRKSVLVKPRQYGHWGGNLRVYFPEGQGKLPVITRCPY